MHIYFITNTFILIIYTCLIWYITLLFSIFIATWQFLYILPSVQNCSNALCHGSLHFSLLNACHVVQAALSAFPRPLMHHSAFSTLCDAIYFLFRLNTALGHSLGLGITPQQVTINPTWFCNLPCMDILLSSLGNPIVLLLSTAVRTDHLYTVWL